jgi:aldehyde:ferredoxin oxidoreductase
MAVGGFNNKVAWIDLTAGVVEYKPIAEDDAKKYIGGRGLGVKYVFDNGPQVDPLSPDNLLCIMLGPVSRHRCEYERALGRSHQIAPDRHRH